MFYQVITTTGRFPTESIEIRAFPSMDEIEVANKQGNLRSVSISPNSVYVGVTGSNWSVGAWQKVVDMVHYTNTHGMRCWLVEFPDQCVTLPYDAIGVLKDKACWAALDAGFEWILLVDNDILPEPDLLVRLVDWGMPVVVPLMIDHKLHLTLSSPIYPPNSGLKRVRWAALSCILIRTKVLNCFPPGTLFTHQVLEPELYEKLSHYGHEVCIDTNQELKLAKGPSYPGDIETLTDKIASLDRADRMRKEKPNRRPIDTEDKREMYLPQLLEGPPEPISISASQLSPPERKVRKRKVKNEKSS